MEVGKPSFPLLERELADKVRREIEDNPYDNEIDLEK